MARVPLSLVVRADATPGIGAGHVMRCVALCEAWRRAHGPAHVWGRVEIPFVRRRLEQADIAWTAHRPPASELLLVDSYDPDTRIELGADESFGARALVDDACEAVPSGYDAVWNPSPTVDARSYPGFEGIVLAGPDSIPLRASLPRWTQASARPRSAAVMLGGSEVPASLVRAIVSAAARADGWEFAGSGAWAPEPWHRIPADDPWSVAATASCVVTAAGTTLLEAASVGAPVVALKIAANQGALAAWALGAGVPTLDLTQDAEFDTLGERLSDALALARPLPRLENGAPGVAAALAELASRRARVEASR